MKRSTPSPKPPSVHKPGPPWTKEELRVLDRYVRLVLDGKLPSPRQAVSSCLPELERVREKLHSGHVRTWEATYRALLQRIPPRFRQRYRRPPSWTPAEMRIVNRYAQAVADGKYASAGDAAEACVAPLAELRRRLEGPRPCAPVRRSQTSTYGRIRIRACELGVRPAWTHSSPVEKKVVLEWTERYWRTRDVKPPWYIMDLADLMRTELQNKGFDRTQGFCERALARRIRLTRRDHTPEPGTRFGSFGT
jgi:hypothetical protein